MKTSPKGFISPLLLALIALLVLGGGAYVYIQNKQGNQSDTSSTALPVIYSISPTRIVPWNPEKGSGTKFTVAGKNFDYVYPSSCDPMYSCETSECLQQECLQKNHVFFKITDNNGHTLIQEDYPSLGPGDFSITETMPSLAWNGTNAWEPVLPGQYSFSVSVDGRGTSNSVPITITNANEAVAPVTNTPPAQPDPFQNLSKEQQQELTLARAKARDAHIQSNLSTIQSQARINYSDVGKTYTDFCSDPFVVNALSNIRTATGITPTTCNSSANAFAASSPLATDSTKFWCVDSTGFRGKIATSLGTSTVCSKNVSALAPIISSIATSTDHDLVNIVISGSNFINWSTVEYLNNGKLIDSFCGYPGSNGTLTHSWGQPEGGWSFYSDINQLRVVNADCRTANPKSDLSNYPSATVDINMIRNLPTLK